MSKAVLSVLRIACFFRIQFKLACSTCLILFWTWITLFNTSCWLLLIRAVWHLCFLLYCIHNLLSELVAVPGLLYNIDVSFHSRWGKLGYLRKFDMCVYKNNSQKKLPNLPTLIFLALLPEPQHIFCLA